MTKLNVMATFSGADGSCGYDQGVRYQIVVSHEPGKNTVVTDATGKHLVEYESALSFLNNWDNISHVKNGGV